jgi:hypothetical protein
LVRDAAPGKVRGILAITSPRASINTRLIAQTSRSS